MSPDMASTLTLKWPRYGPDMALIWPRYGAGLAWIQLVSQPQCVMIQLLQMWGMADVHHDGR